MVCTTVPEEIERRLGGIETQESVRIVYACESGSRAWGFESEDSDYDVRFLYVHRRDWYLSVRRGCEIVLERKRVGAEFARAPQIGPVSDFVESELARHETRFAVPDAPRPCIADLDEIFMAALEEANWPGPPGIPQ